MKYYAGIGSRETPEDVCLQMSELACILEEMNFTLRSGNAMGADQAFSEGVSNAAQIWLPWDSFNSGFKLIRPYHEYKVIDEFDKEAWSSVVKFHPSPHSLSLAACKFMARNYRQVIGLNESNSEFILCWTREGKLRGGTAFAIRVANANNITVVNMFHHKTTKEVIEQLKIYGEI